jgi:hypothetical protein
MIIVQTFKRKRQFVVMNLHGAGTQLGDYSFNATISLFGWQIQIQSLKDTKSQSHSHRNKTKN